MPRLAPTPLQLTETEREQLQQLVNRPIVLPSKLPWLNRDSRELGKQGLQQGCEQSFTSFSHIVDKFKEAQIKG